MAFAVLTAAGAGKAASAHAETQGERIVAIAASQAGKPYCWAGGNQNGPTQGTAEPGTGYACGAGVVGFDCTGLTIYAVFQATGIHEIGWFSLLLDGSGETLPESDEWHHLNRARFYWQLAAFDS